VSIAIPIIITKKSISPLKDDEDDKESSKKYKKFF